MKTVFLSGSRAIKRLNDTVTQRLQNICDNKIGVLVGDANGADKAMQSFLSQQQHPDVTVFYAGAACRNNLGCWTVKKVSGDAKLRGRALHTQKDKAMAALADYGLVLWDGKSAGSLTNVFELLEQGKSSAVYFAPKKEFFTVKNADDVKVLVARCDGDVIRGFEGSAQLKSRLAALGFADQTSFDL